MNMMSVSFETNPVTGFAKKFSLPFAYDDVTICCVRADVGYRSEWWNVRCTKIDRRETLGFSDVQKNGLQNLLIVKTELDAFGLRGSPILIGRVLVVAVEVVGDFAIPTFEQFQHCVAFESRVKEGQELHSFAT